MIDNIRVIGWLLLCLFFEVLAISAVVPLRAVYETPGKSPIITEGRAIKVISMNATVY